MNVYAYHGPGTEQGTTATPAAPEAGGGVSAPLPPKPESPEAPASTGDMAAGGESGFASAIAWKPPASLPTASKQAASAASNPSNPAQATPPPAAQTSATKSGQGAAAASSPNPSTAQATTSAGTKAESAPAAQTTMVASAAPPPKPAAPIPEVKYAASAPPASKLPPAAASLAAQAEQQRQRGDYVAAAATLERAIRIQPRDPYLWNRLARVRLDQKNYSQAGSLAQKSNSLAKDEDRIKQDNWGMIGAARTAAGDPQGAKEAQAKAGIK